MPEPKTKKTEKSAAAFFASIKDERVRQDCKTISAIMQAATKEKAVMWGSSIVGFGHHRSIYASGKESNWMLVAFSPRKQNIVLYLMIGHNRQEHLLAKLGKHTASKGCLYIKHLSDIHLPTLKKLVAAAVKERKKTHFPRQKRNRTIRALYLYFADLNCWLDVRVIRDVRNNFVNMRSKFALECINRFKVDMPHRQV